MEASACGCPPLAWRNGSELGYGSDGAAEVPPSSRTHGPPAQDPSNHPTPWGNVWFLVLPCQVTELLPHGLQRPTFLLLSFTPREGSLPSSCRGQGASISFLEKPNPVPQPVAFTFRSSVNKRRCPMACYSNKQFRDNGGVHI